MTFTTIRAPTELDATQKKAPTLSSEGLGSLDKLFLSLRLLLLLLLGEEAMRLFKGLFEPV